MTNSGLFLCLLLTLGSIRLQAQILPESGDLMGELVTITGAMPGAGSSGYQKPSVDTLGLWSGVFEALANEQFNRADTLIRQSFPFYELLLYTDTGFQNKQYYLLREKSPVLRGWGTFVVNPQYEREIAVELPHARYDTNTHREGSNVFRETGAHFLLMCGTHRCANPALAGCSGSTSACSASSQPYRESDMAHNTQAVFQRFHEVISANNPGLFALNLHGHATAGCEDFFLSSGVSNTTTPLLLSLKAHILASGGVTVAVAGDGSSSCTLAGTTNTQGRFTNNSANPCNTAATSTNGYFMHVEQSRQVRDNYSRYSKLINALNDNISTVTGIAERPIPPSQIADFSIYPNPFNPATSISFTLAVPQSVTLILYDALGRQVRTLLQHRQLQGRQVIPLEATSLPAGLYFVLLKSRSTRHVKKLVLSK